MCGLCTETITLSYIEHESKGQQADFSNGFRFNYLQESADLINSIRSGSLPEINSIETEVLILRLLERNIEQGLQEAGFDDLLAVSGQESVTAWLEKVRTTQQDEYWRELGNQNLYTNANYWAGFIGNTDYTCAKALEILSSYLAWCHEQEEQEPPALMLPDDAENSEAGQEELSYWQEHFHTHYPCLFFSLTFLGKYEPRAAVLKDIALVNPPLCDFLGYDLWLQRKAFLSCVKAYGVDFIIDNFSDIRYELIYYAALKLPFSSADRAQLRQLIAADQQHFTVNVEADHVLALLA